MGLNRLKKDKGGFTLIEIMLVCAILALLCAISVPEFLKARRRSQAVVTVQEFKKVQDAIDQWAIEWGKADSDTVGWNDIKEYVKSQTPLYNRNGNDFIGHPFVFSSVASGVKVDEITRVYFSGVNVDFSEWQQ